MHGWTLPTYLQLLREEKCLTATCAAGAGRFVPGLGSGCAQLGLMPGLLVLPLKHPATSKRLCVAAFPVLPHFLAMSYTADLQASQNASVPPWYGMLETPGHFPWKMGSWWDLGHLLPWLWHCLSA